MIQHIARNGGIFDSYGKGTKPFIDIRNVISLQMYRFLYSTNVVLNRFSSKVRRSSSSIEYFEKRIERYQRNCFKTISVFTRRRTKMQISLRALHYRLLARSWTNVYSSAGETNVSSEISRQASP